MNVNLPSDVKEFVIGLVTDGRFDSEEEVITEGLRLLKSRETLRTAVAKGLKQLDDGESFDEDSVFAGIRNDIDRIEAENQGS